MFCTCFCLIITSARFNEKTLEFIITFSVKILYTRDITLNSHNNTAVMNGPFNNWESCLVFYLFSKNLNTHIWNVWFLFYKKKKKSNKLSVSLLYFKISSWDFWMRQHPMFSWCKCHISPKQGQHEGWLILDRFSAFFY